MVSSIPADAFYDVDGTRWNALGGAMLPGAGSGIPFTDEQQLAEIRGQCRALAAGNEFAINGHENRISYIVGSGHVYRAVARKGRTAPESLLSGVQAVLDEFVRINHWRQRQQEIVRRKDRDGECFLRLFPAAGRHNPSAVRRAGPGGDACRSRRRPSASFGIETDPADVETVMGYWIDGRLIDAGGDPAPQGERRRQREARPAAVLSRAEESTPRGKTAAEHERGVGNPIGDRHHPQALGGDKRGPGAIRGQPGRLERDQPGHGPDQPFQAICPGHDSRRPSGTEYEFPASGIDAGRYVAVLQAELRAIASRLVMPEFMLSSDASNANYSSTMVAEGPAVKMFERLAARDAGRRRGRDAAGDISCGRSGPVAGRGAITTWTFAAFRPRWPCATG